MVEADRSVDKTSPWVLTLELAEILKVHRGTIRRWANDGQLPAPKISEPRRRWLRSGIEAWLEGESQSGDAS